jgi:hypothetical protein
MNYLDADPVAEIWKTRAHLLEKYGGLDGYLKHLDEERPRLEQAGWKYETPEETQARKKRHQTETRAVR